MSNKFSMYAGDTPTLVGTVLQATDGPPFDLSGWGVECVGPDFTAPGTVIDGPSGAYSVMLPSSATASYKRGAYRYRIAVTKAGARFTVINDQFQVTT